MSNILSPFSTTKRAYNILLSMVSIVPILFTIYIFISLPKEGLIFSEFLSQNVWNSILLLVILIDLAWVYILLKTYPEFENENGHEYTGFMLWILFLSQIVVTNILLAIISGIVLYKLKVKFTEVAKLNIMIHNKWLTIMALSLLLFSLLCGFALIRLNFS